MIVTIKPVLLRNSKGYNVIERWSKVNGVSYVCVFLLRSQRQHIKKPAKKFNNSTSCTQACHPCRKPFPTLRSTYIPRMYDFVHSFLVLYMYNWCYLKMKSILLILFLCLMAQLIVVDSYLSIDIQKLPEEQIERFVKYCSSKAQYWRPGRRRYRRFRRFRNRRTVSKSDIRSSLSHSCLIESTMGVLTLDMI